MISEDRVKGSYGIGVGMLFGILRMWLWIKHFPLALTLPVFIVATAIFTYGCVFYSKSKGYAPLLGLLGLLWIPGLVVLLLLPDKKDTFFQDLRARQAEITAQRMAARQKR